MHTSQKPVIPSDNAFIKRFELIKGSRFFLTRSLPPKSWKQGHELINDGDERHVPHTGFFIVDHDHPIGLINFNPILPCSAGEHQSIIGVQFAQLARTNLHIQHDPPAQRLVNVLSHERDLRLAAHAVGALESQIPTGSSAKIQHDALWPEHTLCFLLSNGMTVLRGIPAEDIAEIYVANHVRQVADERVLHR